MKSLFLLMVLIVSAAQAEIIHLKRVKAKHYSVSCYDATSGNQNSIGFYPVVEGDAFSSTAYSLPVSSKLCQEYKLLVGAASWGVRSNPVVNYYINANEEIVGFERLGSDSLVFLQTKTEEDTQD